MWLNSNKQVIYIVKNASPKVSNSKVYQPKSLAKYVIELPAGTVTGKAIKTGAMADFKINDSDVK